MIKARIDTYEGRHLVFLGLTPENIARLMDDKPILVDTAADPPEGLGIVGGPKIAICVGASNGQIEGWLKGHYAGRDDT